MSGCLTPTKLPWTLRRQRDLWLATGSSETEHIKDDLSQRYAWVFLTSTKFPTSNSMKRSLFILLLGLGIGAAAYGCIYTVCMLPARSLERSERPELAWLKEEFHLSDAELNRVSELHTAYLPQCREKCRMIAEQNEHLQTLLAAATNSTPEIDAALVEVAQMRSGCQRMMLHHFFQVSQTMPPEQGRRYLSWVKEKVFAPDYGMKEQK
jgi:hypothetical protein